MKNEIGIGILDLFSREDLHECINSIPEDYKNNIVVVSNKKTENGSGANRIYDKEVSFATLRNYALTQLRIMGFKYYFILNSNLKIKSKNLFEKTIKTANVFGTWFMTGPSTNNTVTIEDDDYDLSLNLTPELNSNFIFMYSGIIKNFNFFDERYYNTMDLDVLDYILKMRKSNLYPPNHYNPTIASEDVSISDTKIQKINFKTFEDLKENSNKTLEMSLAYFVYKHKYIPGQNDPTGVTKEELFTFMENLQKTYGNRN
jgi:hypothetical protein